METKFIMISSSKGGVGKSTVALGISKELALLGESVLLCDLDFGNACQDILLGFPGFQNICVAITFICQYM